MARRARKPKAEKKQGRRMLEADPLVQDLVKKHHKHLERAKIIVLGKPKATKRHGKTVYATGQAAPEWLRVLSRETAGEDLHYLITVGLDAWDVADIKTKRAALDEVLCGFAGQDGNTDKWGTRGPDITGYRGNIERFGAWHADLQLFCAAVKQLTLNLEPADGGKK